MLTFVDRAARFARPDLDAVTVRLLCHNGDLPSRLPFGADATDFELPTGGPVRRIVALTKPTPVVQPSTGHGRLWRLVSQLSLNYLSLVDDGLPTLRELLRLHNLADLPAVERQIQGLVGLRTGPTFARVAAAEGLAFARGTRVELELDEDQFVGAGAFLFAAVLERFFALYASMNSFTQVAVRTRQRQERLHEWAPRAGTRVLV
jgi:type VI secretion system protein ImpG